MKGAGQGVHLKNRKDQSTCVGVAQSLFDPLRHHIIVKPKKGCFYRELNLYMIDWIRPQTNV